ncbi:MAG: RNA polymerase factor sigma-54 [Deltaproteobacteria bacterium]|nr:RNA polymerase factor sigma-54 [Deltaproteobacteria bacterium]
MALELKQTLSLTQQLIMTPQLQQAIKLLQLSRLELQETLSQELESNPMLEERADEEDDADTPTEASADDSDEDVPALPEVTVGDKVQGDVDWETYISEYNTGWAEVPYEDREMPSFESMTATKTSLYTHLMWQLNMSDLGDAERDIAVHIIWNLNEDGYLVQTLEELAESTGHSAGKVGETLKVIQKFDPVGVAARDARESLLIQATFHELEGTLVETLVRDHLKDLEGRRYDTIARALSIPVQEVLDAVAVLQGLEPKPGRLYSDEETIYITPDIYVIRVGDDYEILLNEDGLPKLRINSYYREILSNKTTVPENTRAYVQEKLRAAAWLIKSIHQRQRTIYRVTESIIKFQRDFLDQGITHLKPLVLRDVAEEIEMHESTVSRVTTNKYVHTPQGVFELKFFFNSAIKSLEGDDVASESVKEHIRTIVKTENKAKPYSDEDLVEILKKVNINVARRTVAKYRESIGILPSRKRKNPY